MNKGHLLSYVFGSAMIIAAIGDYGSHLWTDAPSPHPVWAPIVFLGAGVLLLFPEKLKDVAEWADAYILPWLPWSRPIHRGRDDGAD